MEFKTTLNLGRTSVTECQAVPEGVWMKASIKVSIDPIAPIDAEFTAQAKQAPVKSPTMLYRCSPSRLDSSRSRKIHLV